jgi:hypothetical protein
MSIAKIFNKESSTMEIRKDNGDDFVSSEERGEYIRTYYKNIYKRGNRARVTEADIWNFLGEIGNHPEMISSRLTNVEMEDLDKPLTVSELDNAIDQCNIKSAPGQDGISNKFIKHFWEYFRIPLWKYALACYERGSLTENFRSANIKLIPKKKVGVSDIKNWRPISLLNCFYKCISRVFANRLKKYIEKLCPRAQKGYSNNRYCQEVLIGVVETIEKCNWEKKKGGVLSLDIKKAFDSLSHSYLESVFKFYNFGPNICKWLKLMATNRKACIVLDDGSVTIFFDLERGNAQGDTLSPFLFMLGYQILLMKLDLNLQIEGLLERVEIPENHPVPPPYLKEER